MLTVRRLMGVNGVRKEAGCSWIDVKNTTFVFTVHDRSHPRTDEIYKMLRKLEELVKRKGYEPGMQCSSQLTVWKSTKNKAYGIIVRN
jgi:hypothetical protein